MEGGDIPNIDHFVPRMCHGPICVAMPKPSKKSSASHNSGNAAVRVMGLSLALALFSLTACAQSNAVDSAADMLGRPAVRVLTLSEIIGLALQHDIGIAMARCDRGYSKADRMAAESSFDLNLTARADATKNQIPSGWERDSIDNGGGAGLSQKLITGGTLSIGSNVVRKEAGDDPKISSPSYQGGTAISFTQPPG